jgi:hypothetical protein
MVNSRADAHVSGMSPEPLAITKDQHLHTVTLAFEFLHWQVRMCSQSAPLGQQDEITVITLDWQAGAFALA